MPFDQNIIIIVEFFDQLNCPQWKCDTLQGCMIFCKSEALSLRRDHASKQDGNFF